MSKIRAIAALIVLIAGPLFSFSAPVSAAQLVSLAGIELKPEEYLWGFSVDIKHARIVAVCRIVDGWDIKEANYAEFALSKDGGAHISGDATVGHVALDLHTVGQLYNLFLIEPDPKFGPEILEGSIHIEGLNSAEADSGDHKLSRSSFVLEPADRCP